MGRIISNRDDWLLGEGIFSVSKNGGEGVKVFIEKLKIKEGSLLPLDCIYFVLKYWNSIIRMRYKLFVCLFCVLNATSTISSNNNGWFNTKQSVSNWGRRRGLE